MSGNKRITYVKTERAYDPDGSPGCRGSETGRRTDAFTFTEEMMRAAGNRRAALGILDWHESIALAALILSPLLDCCEVDEGKMGVLAATWELAEQVDVVHGAEGTVRHE